MTKLTDAGTLGVSMFLPLAHMKILYRALTGPMFDGQIALIENMDEVLPEKSIDEMHRARELLCRIQGVETARKRHGIVSVGEGSR